MKLSAAPENPLRRRWNRFQALSRADQTLFVKLWVMLAIVSLLVRLLDYQGTRRLLSRSLSRATVALPGSQDGMSYALRVGKLTRIAGRHLPTNASCLRQSLLVWWLLRRRGLPAELQIGVSQSEGFSAHAWVELEGRPINDSDDVASRFTAFERAH